MEIKFTRSQSLAIKEALAARFARMQHANELMEQAQKAAAEAAQEYDAVLLEVLEDHGVSKIPEKELEPTFFPQNAKRPDGLRWLDAPKTNAPPQGNAALDAAKAEVGAKKEPKGEITKLPEPKAEEPEKPAPKPLAASASN